MITLIRPAYYENERRAEYKGVSADDKSTIKAQNGDKFYEIDTSKWFIYDEDISAWVEMGISQVVGSFNLPKISPSTTGLFLTNDGTFAHWRESSLSDFIVTLTDNKNGTYTADKNYLEIRSALEAKENIAVFIGNGNTRLPLMNAEIAENGDAGFTFGYTKVTLDGQLVSTRAVNYHHTADPVSDEWTDIDQAAEYLKTSGGTLDGNLSMGGANITDVQEIQVNPANPVYIGSVVHAQGTNGVRLTATTNDELAVVAPDSQSTYKPVHVGNPTALTHAVTLGYLAQEQKDATATKKSVDLAANSAITVSLDDGVYLMTACDERHRGLTCVFVCGTTSTVFDLSGMAGWAVSKNDAKANAIYIDNKIDTPLTVYITAVGNGNV